MYNVYGYIVCSVYAVLQNNWRIFIHFLMSGSVRFENRHYLGIHETK